jgi:hypothetical protein
LKFNPDATLEILQQQNFSKNKRKTRVKHRNLTLVFSKLSPAYSWLIMSLKNKNLFVKINPNYVKINYQNAVKISE